MANKLRPLDRLYVSEWMHFLGKTNKDLQEKGVNKGYITELKQWDKRGKAPNPSLLVIGQVARALGIQPAALFNPPPVLGAPVRVSRTQIGMLTDISDQARQRARQPRDKGKN